MANETKTLMAHGRIVWVSGDLFKGKVKTIFGTQTPKLNALGATQNEYGFGLAIPKSDLQDPEKGKIWAALHEEAFTMFPSRQIPPSFAMKYKDGDGIDDKGIPFAKREGYAGHIIFNCTTTLPIKYFIFENGQNFLVESGIKCGDYVSVQITIKAHPAIGQGKAGMYINPYAVRLTAPGKEIINIPSPDTIFGSQAPVMPQNYVAPVQPTGGFIMPPQQYAPPPVQPQYAPAPQQYAPPPVQPQYAPAPQQYAPPPVQPNYGVIPPVHQPQYAPPPVQPNYGVIPPVHQPQYAPAPVQPGMPPIPQFPGL